MSDEDKMRTIAARQRYLANRIDRILQNEEFGTAVGALATVLAESTLQRLRPDDAKKMLMTMVCGCIDICVATDERKMQ